MECQADPPSVSKMTYEYAITVGALPSAPGAELGRALERLAFFPGITKAAVLGHDSDSITIGYNGHPCSSVIRELSAELAAEGLVAHGELWHLLPKSMETDSAALPLSALYRRDSWLGHFERAIRGTRSSALRPAASGLDQTALLLAKPWPSRCGL